MATYEAWKKSTHPDFDWETTVHSGKLKVVFGLEDISIDRDESDGVETLMMGPKITPLDEADLKDITEKEADDLASGILNAMYDLHSSPLLKKLLDDEDIDDMFFTCHLSVLDNTPLGKACLKAESRLGNAWDVAKDDGFVTTMLFWNLDGGIWST